jgi:hypothetical protein
MINKPIMPNNFRFKNGLDIYKLKVFEQKLSNKSNLLLTINISDLNFGTYLLK